MNVGNTRRKTLKVSYFILTSVKLLSNALITNAAMPETSFACQVIHPNQGVKLVLVQSDFKNEAIEIAGLDQNTRTINLDVIECIVIGEEKFKDKIFRKIFDKNPM